MPSYDVIMLIVLISATVFGAIKGFAWQVASLASIIVSYGVAYYFRNDVAKMINAQHPWNLFIAMLVLYAGSSFLIWMVFRLVSTSIDKVKLKEFDRHMGALFGFGKGLVFCLLITMFAMTLLGPSKQQAICASRSGFYISKFLAGADGLFPKEIDQVIQPHLQRLEQQLEQGRGGTLVSTPSTDTGWNLGNLINQGPSNAQIPGNNQIIPTIPTNFPGTQNNPLNQQIIPNQQNIFNQQNAPSFQNGSGNVLPNNQNWPR